MIGISIRTAAHETGHRKRLTDTGETVQGILKRQSFDEVAETTCQQEGGKVEEQASIREIATACEIEQDERYGKKSQPEE